MTEPKLFSCGGIIGAYNRACPTKCETSLTDPDCHAVELEIKDNKLVRAFITCSWCHADAGDATYHDIMGVLHWWDVEEDYEQFLELLISEYGEPRGKPISYERDSDDNVIQSTIKYEGEEE